MFNNIADKAERQYAFDYWRWTLGWQVHPECPLPLDRCYEVRRLVREAIVRRQMRVWAQGGAHILDWPKANKPS